jgi:hypothetical protein
VKTDILEWKSKSDSRIAAQWDTATEEGRAASKSPYQKFGYFLSMSQQGVSADIIQNQLFVCLLCH